MRNPRDLVEFLFRDSQDAAERELARSRDLSQLFEEMGSQEATVPEKTPLKSALAALGVKGELRDDPEGFCVVVDNHEDYQQLASRLKSVESMEKLAKLGWVVTDCGDVAMTGECPEYRVRFLEISTPEADNSTKQSGTPELEKLVKSARDFSFSPKEEQPEPKLAKGGVGRSKDGPKPVSARESIDRLVARLLED